MNEAHKEISNLWDIYKDLKSLQLLEEKVNALNPSDAKDQLLLEVELLKSNVTLVRERNPKTSAGYAGKTRKIGKVPNHQDDDKDDLRSGLVSSVEEYLL